jgi:hypothetical protein
VTHAVGTYIAGPNDPTPRGFSEYGVCGLGGVHFVQVFRVGDRVFRLMFSKPMDPPEPAGDSGKIAAHPRPGVKYAVRKVRLASGSGAVRLTRIVGSDWLLIRDGGLVPCVSCSAH